MQTREKLYEGKAEIGYSTDRPGLLVQHFKDDATAFKALTRGTIVGQGLEEAHQDMHCRLIGSSAAAGAPSGRVGEGSGGA